MRRLAIAVVAPLALLLAACDSGGAPSESTPTRTPPADPTARFKELEDLRNAASFHIVYDEDTGYHDGSEEFAWLQDGKRVRWEEANTREDAIAADSSIDDGGGSGLTCAWVTKKDWTAAQVSCYERPRAIDMRFLDEQINGLSGEIASVFPEEVEFVDFRTVLDREVECFKATYGAAGDSTRCICYTAEGLPLAVASQIPVGDRQASIVLTAKEIRPPPSEAELLTPIIPDTALGQTVTLREIPLDELVLPSLPIIEDFFSEAGQAE